MSRLNGQLNGHARKPGGRPERLKTEADAAYERMRAAAFDSIAGSVMALGAGGYDAASTTRLRPDAGRAGGGSADSHRNTSVRQSLSRQCQDLERNSALARSLVERKADLTVADGFGLRVKTDLPEWNAACEWLVNRVAGEDEDGTPRPEMLAGLSDQKLAELPTFDIRGKWSLSDALCDISRRWDYDGDIGVNFVSTGSVQFVEGERIVNPGRAWDRGVTGSAGTAGNAGEKNSGPPIVGGVEMDSYGKAVRYHVATYNAQGSIIGRTTTAVDAANFMLLCNPLRDVVGSTRGEPQLQACLKRLDHLEGMDETVLVAARVQAAIAAVIITKRPDLDLLNAAGSTETRAEDGEQERWQEFEGGIVKHLEEGEEVSFPPPGQPGQNHESYCLFQMLIVCAELGVPLPLAMLDGRQLNLSTIRCITQVAVKRLERNQKALKKFCTRWYRFIVPFLIRGGFLPFNAQWEAHEWMAPPPPVMDPTVELAEARGLIDARIMSKKRVAMQKYGVNTTTEDDQIETELKQGAKRGILPLTAPGSGGSGGGGGSAGGAGSPGASQGGNAEDAEGAEDKTDETNGTNGTDGPGGAAGSGAGVKSAKSGKSGADGGYLVGDKTLAADMVRQVSSKGIPGDSAKVILTEMVGMDESQASAIIDPATKHTVPEPSEPKGPPE